MTGRHGGLTSVVDPNLPLGSGVVVRTLHNLVFFRELMSLIIVRYFHVLLNIHFVTYTDPLSDLTKDQRVALYTLLLCDGIRGVYVDDDVTMGDIDVRRTLSDLEEKGLITRDEASVEIPSNQYEKIMRFYRENCLLSDIDKDFYIQVASNESLHIYADVYLRQSAEKEKPEDIPIKLLRLVLEGRAKDAGMSIPGTSLLIRYFKVNIN